jgi:hypothetical protein
MGTSEFYRVVESLPDLVVSRMECADHLLHFVDSEGMHEGTVGRPVQLIARILLKKFGRRE